ncbi:single-stranded-DNA-specific exonuclease RecJ [Nevskia sp.]|uniref:single-stranded-DNA-specific exonuclease RecJ n=1 Tax=Nevskia sp. TaxID=1929292 RepID=UPI0025F5F84E|nr:single-stranded-DNA-specific exonuclease RecJ [Nevskia sp.]
MKTPQIRRRPPGEPQALPANLSPVLRRIYAARGLKDPSQLALDLKNLLPPDQLLGIDRAAELLAQAIRDQKHIVIAGDYDADGATACSVAMLGLTALGAAKVGYVVPNRFTMGYGLSPPLVDLAREQGAELLVTVDNGIASLAGIDYANSLGLPVLVTDHHLAGPELPAAAAIVNPNQPGCPFPSKHLAGVGVMFYVLLALRARLRSDGAFGSGNGPNLAELLDLVALGTVADVVKLDYNNRILVQQGITRIRAGRARPGLAALLEAAGRTPERINASDLGFVLGPRLNAAGRLDDMRRGIECLLAVDRDTALPIAQELDKLNRERRGIEAQMRDDALALVAESEDVGVVVHEPDWHEGVVGLVASRVKDALHRPVIAFACAQERGMLKGSGRSIPGLHLRDALAAVDAQYPGLITRFGGHAMAAGLTMPEEGLAAFSTVFDAQCRAMLDADQLSQVIDTDGELRGSEFSIDTATTIESAGPWGQGFPEPRFDGEFEVLDLRPVGKDGNHVRYRLKGPAGVINAVHFNGAETAIEDGRVRVVYQLSINRWQDRETLELRVDLVERA